MYIIDLLNLKRINILKNISFAYRNRINIFSEYFSVTSGIYYNELQSKKNVILSKTVYFGFCSILL